MKTLFKMILVAWLVIGFLACSGNSKTENKSGDNAIEEPATKDMELMGSDTEEEGDPPKMLDEKDEEEEDEEDDEDKEVD